MDNTSLLNLFSIKDKRIVIKDVSKIKESNKSINIIYADLLYIPKCCYKCKSTALKSHGIDTIKVQLSNISNTKAIMYLNKRRCKCNSCNTVFSVNCKDVKKHSRKSKQVITAITHDLITTTNSMTEIAKRYNVSISTVKRVLEINKKTIKVNKQILPKVLCIDENAGIKTYKGKYNCVIQNGETGTIKDYIFTRRKNDLIKYFKTYTFQARNDVQFFVTDMWDSYIDIAKKYFKNSIIVLDRFHIIALAYRLITDLRVNLMNSYRKDSLEYRVLKKFNKKLVKKYKNLSTEYVSYKYYPMFHNEFDILNFMLNLDEDLKKAYYILQDLYFSIDSKDISYFRNLLKENDYKNIKNEKLKRCVKTLNKYRSYIENSIIYKYSNGKLEAANRIIKLLKRNACGYRNFENFRTRILLIFNYIAKSKQLE
ncbi:ISL3 family transposase [Gemella sp. GH3]|uniref:ISL3 family transposase n=1 Tax=unclassified Gemella TaxID=2624949 RepID=UPI0015D0B573|nr:MULTISPECIES: ISL3 family transposase [unclassified Gemella]MBF0714064.1 ISL3 family transposase [Gemella sp. GH3.1]NYS51016.1 ISL3 family transposase [Gemella sp. GH3]